MLEDPDRFLRVIDAWEFDNNLIITARLYERLTNAETVHPALERLAGSFQGVAVKRLSHDWARLQHDLKSSLKIETLTDGMSSSNADDVEVRTGKRDPAGNNGQQDDECQSQQGSIPQLPPQLTLS